MEKKLLNSSRKMETELKNKVVQFWMVRLICKETSLAEYEREQKKNRNKLRIPEYWNSNLGKEEKNNKKNNF